MAHVVVLVLGDVGRSPRMQQHASSLAGMDEVAAVTLVGFQGERCFEKVERHPKIRKRLFAAGAGGGGLLRTAARGVLLCWRVLRALLSVPAYDVVLVQNPPSLPALLVVSLLAFFVNGSAIVLDWHNLGFTLYRGQLPERHPLVLLYRALESCLGLVTEHHICVSAALRDWLRLHFKVDAVVVYDRPSDDFSGELAPERRHALLKKLGFVDSALFYQCQDTRPADDRAQEELTIQTRLVLGASTRSDRTTNVVLGAGGGAHLRADRTTALIVTATSWTPDEDLGLLLAAVRDLDEHMARLVRCLVVVTGKGPGRARFEERMREANLLMSHVAVRTAWLEPDEYPLLLRCADLGVCMHTSSSGLDLPMKVLDMFGSGLPVCAVDFPAISELVVNGINGIIFRDAPELSNHLNRLLSGFPRSQEELSRMRRSVAGFERWDAHWTRTCEPVVLRALRRSRSSYGLPRSRLSIALLLALLALVFLLDSGLRLRRVFAL